MSLNLSTSAVSIVLNARAGAESIPAVTRERILAAARGLHYRPNVLAQSLRRRRAFTIGVLVPDLAAAGSALAQAITDTLRMAGYDVLLATHQRRPDLVAARARLMLERQVDGLIVADGGGIASAPVPVVRLAYTCDRLHASSASLVALDLAASADAAIRHVVDMGHRRLALLSAAMPFGCSWGRALTRAARHIGVQLDTRRTAGGNVSAFEHAYLAARDLIAEPNVSTRHSSRRTTAPRWESFERYENTISPCHVMYRWSDLETTWTPLLHATPDDGTCPVTASW